MLSDVWIEKLNDENAFEFKAVKYNEDNGLLLYDSNRKVYVEINRSNCNFGIDEENLKLLYEGTWINEDFPKRLADLAEENLNGEFKKCSLSWKKNDGIKLKLQ